MQLGCSVHTIFLKRHLVGSILAPWPLKGDWQRRVPCSALVIMIIKDHTTLPGVHVCRQSGALICEDRVLDGPASGGKGSKGRN